MEYAVVLYFDLETEKKLQALINLIADKGAGSYMKEHGIPPHLTLSFFEKETPVGLEDIISACAQEINIGDIAFASIGAFNPSVLFLAPVMSKYLLNSCALVNERLRLTASALSGQYLPGGWVPHVTLATQLGGAQLCRAFEIAQSEFCAFRGRATRIVLAQCNPYREIRVWELREDVKEERTIEVD